MKRFVCVMLCVCVLLSMVPNTVYVSAEEETVQSAQEQAAQPAGEESAQSAEDETTQSAQSVALWEYAAYGDGIAVTKYNGTATDVFVPATIDGYSVLKLGDGLFENDDTINSVTLADGILEIGERSFYDADNLVCIVTNQTLATIGASAFYSCDLFNSVILYDAVATIGADTFSLCPSLTVWCNEGTAAYSYVTANSIPYEILNPNATPETYVQDGVTYYIMNGEAIAIAFDGSRTEVIIPVVVNGYVVTELRQTFENCTGLISVTIPNSVTSVGNSAFSGCTGLTTINIPDSVTSIGSYAFGGCTSLESITLPEGITSIVDSTFMECTGLRTVNVPDGVTSIGSYAFFSCSSLENIVIPEGVTRIGDETFRYCDSLTSVIIPDGVTAIGYCAFVGCNGLTTVKIPASVTDMFDAFGSCDSLTDVIVGGDPTEWDGSFNLVFEGCENITGIWASEDNPYCSSDDQGVLFNKDMTTLIVAPQKLTGSYTIPDTVTSIGEAAFYFCTSLTEITIPDGVASIGNWAFGYCTNLTKARYKGTDAQWNNVEVGYANDSLLDALGKTTTDTEAKLTWTLDADGTLYVSGSGTMEDYSIDALPPWSEYCTEIISVIVSGGITSIGAYAFYNCENLVDATIPESVTSIGDSAFEYCRKITSITIPDSVTGIGGSAFYGCTGLTSVTIPNSVTSIGKAVFVGCTGLTNITIPDSVISIESSAFGDCTSLISITIPNGVTSIGSNAFSGCTGLISITIPDSVVSIGEGAFERCSGLTTITIPDSVTCIPDYAFQYCTGLTNIEIPSTVTKIGEGAFKYCDKITSITIPAGVTAIGNHAFLRCYSLTSICVAEGNLNYKNDSYGVLFNIDMTAIIRAPSKLDGDYTIPNSVTSIGEGAFRYCSGLTSITIPNSVTSIGDYAFASCLKMTNIIIPDSVINIGSAAFSDCTGLTSITIPDSVTKMWQSSFDGCENLTKLIIADGSETVTSKMIAGLNLVTEITIPNSVTSIGNSAFKGCTKITTITIPDSVTSIGDSAFSSCAGLTSVTIPDSVTSIGEGAFGSCSGLTTITIPDSVTGIGGSAFYGCTGLTSVTIPNSVTSIGGSAFYGCTGLTSVTIPNSVTSIGGSAFSGCTRLTSVTIPDSVTSIGSSAFRGCTGLTGVTIPNSVTSIGGSAFSGCTRLTSVTIPDSVTSIGSSAFRGCTGLTSITIPNSVTSIGSYAFSGCTGLTSITIPNSVTSIGSYAFSGCTGLTSVTIPGSVISIGNYSFSGCTSLTGITIPEGVTTIGSAAFSGCTNLPRWVTIPASVTSMSTYSFPTGIIHMVYENSYAHTFAVENDLLYFIIRKTENPEISFGTEVSGTVSYTDGSAAVGATVEIFYDDGTLKESVVTDDSGSYTFTYAEVGRYTVRVTDADGNTASAQVSVKRMNAFDVFVAGDTALTLKKGYSVSGSVNIGGAMITLTDEHGNVIASVTADESGSFVLESIPNGTYVISAETENGSTSQEITVFDGAVSDILLEIAAQTATIWGYIDVQDRKGDHHRRNWVQVTIYNEEGIAVAQCKSDTDGIYTFSKLTLGTYSIVAETQELRPDKKHNFDRSHTLTGYAYVVAEEATSYQADIVLYEENDRLATVSGKVTAQGQTQKGEVILRNVFRHEVARYATKNNGKYTFTNVRDGLYFITAITESDGMGYAVVVVRDGVVHGETDIVVYKHDKIKDREDRFNKDVPHFNNRDEAREYQSRIAEEKRFYDGLSEKEKRQLSKEYVERLNRYIEWLADIQYSTGDGVTLQQGGLVVSGDELENDCDVNYTITVQKVSGHTPSEDGVKNEKDFIHHAMNDAADKQTIKQHYEITMTKMVDGEQQQITSVYKNTDATGKFRLTLEIPEEHRGHKHYSILHEHHGEIVRLADLDDDPNTITIEVDAFSSFVLTATDEDLIEADTSGVVSVGSATYETLDEALATAQAGDVITLLENVQVGEVALPVDVTLDLNGKILTATDFGGFFGNVVDSSEGNVGLLKVAGPECKSFNPENTDAPLYDESNGGYRFFTYQLYVHKSTDPAGTGREKFWFKFHFYTDDTYKILDEGAYALVKAGGSGMQISANLTWQETGEAQQKLNPVVFSDDGGTDAFSQRWATGAHANRWLYVTVSDLDKVSDGTLTVTPVIDLNGVLATNGTVEFIKKTETGPDYGWSASGPLKK